MTCQLCQRTSPHDAIFCAYCGSCFETQTATTQSTAYQPQPIAFSALRVPPAIEPKQAKSTSIGLWVTLGIIGSLMLFPNVIVPILVVLGIVVFVILTDN